jgi:hypothetical protein
VNPFRASTGPRRTLEEEKETDEKLTELPKGINVQAQQGDLEEEQEDQPRDKRKSRKAA